MSITIPLRNRRRPLTRILTAPSWNLGKATWTEQPYSKAGPKGFGFYLLAYNRPAFPGVGEAKLRFRYGKIDGRMVGIDTKSGAAGQPWDPANNSATAPDLTDSEIRIQQADPVADGSVPLWRTVWWGQCVYMSDTDYIGGSYPSGERIYNCFDGFYRTRRWILNKHGVYITDTVTGDAQSIQAGECRGHPGYNHAFGNVGITRGTKETSGAGYFRNSETVGKVFYHTHEGSGAIWTDKETVEHALAVDRPAGEPVFEMRGAVELFNSNKGNIWPVEEDENAREFVINKICKRERGRGLVYLDWEDDVGTPTGTLDVCLRVRAQQKDDIRYSDPGTVMGVGSTHIIPGATTNGTAITVDLIGDHRNISSRTRIGQRDLYTVDWLETAGENIEALVTLSRYDDNPHTLEQRFSNTMTNDFAALTPDHRIDDAWSIVWRLWGLARAWNGRMGDHNRYNTVPLHRADYRCSDNGEIQTPDLARDHADTSPLVCKLLSDLPLLEGYSYAGTVPVRKDAQVECGVYPRRPPLILIRAAEDRYLTGEQADRQLSLSISGSDIMIYAPSDLDDTGAYRVVGDRNTEALGSLYDAEQLGVTVGIRLPHRVRRSSGDPNGKRHMNILLPGIHLWLASPGAIWDVKSHLHDTDGSPAYRNACGAAVNYPGVLRDDRDALALHHALGCSWYLSDHRPASWALKACGFLPTFEYADGNGEVGGTIAYPKLGEVVTQLSAGGQAHALDTPVTNIAYNNEDCTTEWFTSWCQLDFDGQASA